MPNEVEKHFSFVPKWSSKTKNAVGSSLALFLLIISSFLFRDYIHSVLRWVESQPDPLVFIILILLYTLVSLPFAWGYIVINIATGYLYGLKIGILVTFCSATMGIIVAHFIIKSFFVTYVERLINEASPESMLKKISILLDSKKEAFQLVLLSRLTPIPFGLQNSVFALSTISFDKYLQASCLGLLPCQFINTYLGSTLRSMEEVFGDAKTATVGFTVLLIQLLFVILIVIFVIKKAQSHLNLSGLSTASTNEDIFSKAIVAGDLPSEIIVIPSNEKYEVKR